MLWDEFCLIRLSVQYRGRAVPVVWRVIRHHSSSVGFEVYQPIKSNGFQLERSEIRSAPALSRLCLVMAVTTLLLTVQGQQVVVAGKRRWVDAHWQRGNSYFRIGWNWVKGVLHQGWQLFTTVALKGGTDPEPASASKKQDNKRLEREFTVRSYSFQS